MSIISNNIVKNNKNLTAIYNSTVNCNGIGPPNSPAWGYDGQALLWKIPICESTG